MAFQGGAGNDGVRRAVLRLFRHPVAQVAEPRIAVFVGQRDARAHFVAVGLGVEIAAFGVGAWLRCFCRDRAAVVLPQPQTPIITKCVVMFSSFVGFERYKVGQTV